MGYLTFPPNLRDIFDDLYARIRKLETAQRFTFPVISADPTNGRSGDLWLNSTSNTVKYLDSGSVTQNLYSNQLMAGKNIITNGAMDNWQRGTSISSASSSAAPYTADRWQFNTIGGATACTISRQTTSDTTNLPNIQYAARIQRNSGETGLTNLNFSQSIETISSIPFAGQRVALSFYARAGADFSGGSLLTGLISGQGVDQNSSVSPGYTGSTSIFTTPTTLTTTWQRFTYTGSVSSTATELSVYWIFTPTGTAGTNDYYEITGVQLEIGRASSPFSRASGSFSAELTLCQRYYRRITAGGVYGYLSPLNGASSATNITTSWYLPFPMRAIPTTSYGGNVRYISPSGATTAAISGFTASASNSSTSVISVDVSTTGLTANNVYLLTANNDSTAYLDFSAEL